MEFEYDPTKNVGNKPKHGIDFDEAKSLWEDADRLVFPARSDSELRFAMMGRIRDMVWVVFFTVRQQRIRIISVRPARPNEREEYESRRTG